MRNLHARHWMWLHFKFAVVLWVVAYGAVTPAATIQAIGVLILWIWVFATVIGACVGAAGLIMSEQESVWAQRRGAQVEVAGLSLMAIGPLLYFTTQLAIWFGQTADNWEVRLGPAFMGYALLAAVLARLTLVIPRYRAALAAMNPRRGGDSNG